MKTIAYLGLIAVALAAGMADAHAQAAPAQPAPAQPAPAQASPPARPDARAPAAQPARPDARAPAASTQKPDSDAGVARTIQLALDSLPRLRCSDWPCAPATEAERANPPVTIAEARTVIRRGIISGSAAACGLDWQKQNFGPMMQHFRQRQRKTDRQMAMISALHGIGQGQAVAALKPEACTDAVRRNIASQLPFKP